MTSSKKLYEGLSKTAEGYFFIYFNFSINTVSIIPTFVGYILLMKATKCLQDEERELGLLWNPGDILASWYFFVWLVSWLGINLDGAWPFVDIVINVVNLYFHFQFLTNLASIVERYQSDGSRYHADILQCRTVQTVLLTVILVINNLYPWLSDMWRFISGVLLIIDAIVGIYLTSLMFKIRKHFGNSLKSSAKHFENS